MDADKKRRNKIALVIGLLYFVGLSLTSWSENMLFLGTVLLAVPFLKYIKE